MKFKLFGLFALLTAINVSAADFVLVRNGKAVSQIALETAEDKDIAAHIKRFNSHLRKICGTALPIGSKNLANTIRIKIVPTKKLENVYDWQITFPAKNTMQITAGKYAFFDALAAILEKAADCRFLGVENCMFQYKEQKNIALASKDFKSPEGFAFYRSIWFAPNHRPELSLQGNPYFKYTHGLPVYAFPAAKYKKGWPEVIMPVHGGKKLKRPAQLYYHWQPCYSNPETAKIAIENILEKLAKKPELSITLGVNDNFGYCQCKECKKMDANACKSIFSNDNANHSASYYTFVNRVAEGVCKKYPDLRIGVLAYFDTIMPPDFPVHPNVVPMLTLDTVQGAINPETKKRHFDIIAEWSKKVKNIGIWEYCWGRTYLIPRVNFKHQAAMMKHLYAHNAVAYFAENTLMADMLDGPKIYITSRMLKDKNADIDTILEEYYTRFAGKKAAPYLKEIYKRSEEYWTSEELKNSPAFRTSTYVYAYPTGLYLFSLKPGFTRGLLELARKVLENAETPQDKKRAEILCRHFEQVDCAASFGAWAYTAKESGEIMSEADAAAYYNMLQKDFARLLKQQKSAEKYFLKADVEPRFSNYTARKLFERDYAKLLCSGAAKTFGFMTSPEVVKAANKAAQTADFPQKVKDMIQKMQMGENIFSGREFAAEPKSMRILNSGVKYGVSSEVLCNGKKTIKLNSVYNKAYSQFIFIENLPEGRYAVSMKVFTKSKSGKADLCFWPAQSGWEEMRQFPLSSGKWQTMSKVCTVRNKKGSKTRFFLRFTDFKADEPVYIGDIRLVKIAE